MSVLDLIQTRAWKLSGGHPQDPALVNFFGYRDTSSGVEVNDSTSMQVAAVFACIRVISEDIAKLPLILYQRMEPRGKKRLDTHRLYRLMHDEPNADMTAFTFRETVIASTLRHGNGYAEIQRDQAEVPAALWPLESTRVRPMREGDALVYEYHEPEGQKRILQQRDMFHLRGMGGDGVCGWSVVRLARETIGASLARERFGAKFFANNAQGGGFLKHPGALTDKAYTRLKEEMAEKWGGVENAFRPKILEEGMEWQDSTLPADDAQFLEMSQFSVEDICRWFRVTPHKVQHLLRATFSNIEHTGLEHTTDTLMPWSVRWEQEANRKMISRERRDLFYEHLFTGLLRGDMAARAAFHTAMFNVGAESPNDIREIENMNPVEDGDDYYRPLNMIPLGEEPPPEPAPEPAPEDSSEEPDDEESEPEPAPARAIAQQIVVAHDPLVVDVLTRLGGIETDRLKKHRGAKDESDQIRRFYDDHRKHVKAALWPALEALSNSLKPLIGNGHPFPPILDGAVDEYVSRARKAAIVADAMDLKECASRLTTMVATSMEKPDGP